MFQKQHIERHTEWVKSSRFNWGSSPGRQPGRQAGKCKQKLCAQKRRAVNKTAPDADKCNASTERERGSGRRWQKIGKLPWQIHIASPFCLLLLHCEIFAMQIGPENCSTLERCSSAIKCKIFNNAAVHKNDRIRKRDRRAEREGENGTRNWR